MPRAVVVGAGIASLYASTLLGRRGYEVDVIEREATLGGLLNSVQNDHGDWFDQGTHFISGTNNAAIDQVILPASATDQWTRFTNERAGNVFAGSYSTGCLFVDTRTLPDAQYERGIADYLATDRNELNAIDLQGQLTHRFGAGFAESVFAPAMGKLFGATSMAELTPNAHLLFGMKRLKAFTAEETRELKADPHHDDRLCFHEFHEGVGGRPQYYPTEGGSGAWIDVLVDGANAAGVTFRTSTTVSDVRTDGQTIVGVELATGEHIECDLLVWAVPLFPLLRSLNIRTDGGPPILRYTTLLHFVFDRPPHPEDYFYFNYDPADVGFRTTLYSNLQPDVSADTGRHRVTVEAVSSQSLDLEQAAASIEQELRRIGTIDQQARLLTWHGQNVREGFPVLSQALRDTKHAQMEAVSDRLDNLILAGRSCTDAWFMPDVFADVHNKITALSLAPLEATPTSE